MFYQTHICPQCGGFMEEQGAQSNKAHYICPCCGYAKAVEVKLCDNEIYQKRKIDLLRRINVGLTESKTTSWQNLQNDISVFMSEFDAENTDISLLMGIIACITNGFTYLDSEKYKQCSIRYKVTEKMYKDFLKSEKSGSECNAYSEYEQHRKLYKKCVNDYKNTRLVKKGAIVVAKQIIFK